MHFLETINPLKISNRLLVSISLNYRIENFFVIYGQNNLYVDSFQRIFRESTIKVDIPQISYCHGTFLLRENNEYACVLDSPYAHFLSQIDFKLLSCRLVPKLI